MKTKTSVKAGGFTLNHNENAKNVRVKSNVKGGGFSLNHNETTATVRS